MVICTNPKCAKELKISELVQDGSGSFCSFCGFSIPGIAGEFIEDQENEDVDNSRPPKEEIALPYGFATDFGKKQDGKYVDKDGKPIFPSMKKFLERYKDNLSSGLLNTKEDKKEIQNIPKFKKIYYNIVPPQFIGTREKPHQVEKTAFDYYKKILKLNLQKGRKSLPMIVATILVAARKWDVLPFSVLKEFKPDNDNVIDLPEIQTIWVYYKLIFNKLGPSQIPVRQTKLLTYQIAFQLQSTLKLKIDYKKIHRRAEEIIKSAKEKGIVARVGTMAPAGVYLALMENKIEADNINWRDLIKRDKDNPDTSIPVIEELSESRSVKKAAKEINEKLSLELEI